MKEFLKSFVYAFNGFKESFVERNFKIHLFAGIVVIAAAIYYQVSNLELIALVFAIFLVVTSEILNTCIETICNILKEKLNLDYEATRIPRDLGAAIVLLNAICAAIIGIIIFWPKVF